MSKLLIAFSLIRFEKLAKEPLKTAMSLMESLSLNITSSTLKYVETHTVEDKFLHEVKMIFQKKKNDYFEVFLIYFIFPTHWDRESIYERKL